MKRVSKSFLWIVLFLIMVAGCGKLPDSVIMEKAKTMEADENFEKAVIRYEKIGKLYPESQYAPEAIYRAGLIYVNAFQQTNEAVSKFQQVIDNYPESEFSAQCLFMKGFVYANSESDTTNARVSYQAFLEKYPDHELVPSVEWELKYLGKDINDIPALQDLDETK